MTDLQKAAARLVASRRDQGLPERVTDPGTLGFLASVAFEQPFAKTRATSAITSLAAPEGADASSHSSSKTG